MSGGTPAGCFSMLVFRTPGPIALCSLPKLVFRLFGAPLGAGELRTDRPGELSKWATAGIRAASVASGLDLLVCSHVGLRCLRVQLGSGNLPLMALGESLVHRSTVQHPAGCARRWYRAMPADKAVRQGARAEDAGRRGTKRTTSTRRASPSARRRSRRRTAGGRSPGRRQRARDARYCHRTPRQPEVIPRRTCATGVQAARRHPSEMALRRRYWRRVPPPTAHPHPPRRRSLRRTAGGGTGAARSALCHPPRGSRRLSPAHLRHGRAGCASACR